ncbi:Gfo/Idh/MocA family protein, partial [Longispora fulva]
LSITHILTSNPKNVEAAKLDFPTAAVVSSYEEILNNPNVDLVIILLPNHLHFEYAKRALEAGKHVVVEKPITPTTAEADELISLAK